jgi:DNA-binding HxlR family transcriptional regulator
MVKTSKRKPKTGRIVENDVYASIIGELERLEREGSYRGNGHHLAQRLTRLVSEGLLPRQQKKIYEALSTERRTAGEIAKACGIRSSLVSAQLRQMRDSTLLVHSDPDPKRPYRKLWSKPTKM